MLRGLERRLERLWTAYRREAAAREAERDERDLRWKLVDTIRAGLARAGIDPATVPALRRFEQPDLVAGPAPPREPAIRAPGPLGRLHGELSRIVRFYRDHPFDLDTATPIDLLAMYCFDDAPAAAPSG